MQSRSPAPAAVRRKRTAAPVHPQRSDGELTRARLLDAGLQLFAQHGYANTSTRDIAEAAQANVSAIRYYFGDKAGLYRAVMAPPGEVGPADLARLGDPQLPLADALRGMYQRYVTPLREGRSTRARTRLHMREAIEPTGLACQGLDPTLRPAHDVLCQVLARHLGGTVDDDLQRLALSLSALGLQLYVLGDVHDTLAPQLRADENALAAWVDRLTGFALAMVQAEQQRRAPPSRPPSPRRRRPQAASP